MVKCDTTSLVAAHRAVAAAVPAIRLSFCRHCSLVEKPEQPICPHKSTHVHTAFPHHLHLSLANPTRQLPGAKRNPKGSLLGNCVLSLELFCICTLPFVRPPPDIESRSPTNHTRVPLLQSALYRGGSSTIHTPDRRSGLSEWHQRYCQNPSHLPVQCAKEPTKD